MVQEIISYLIVIGAVVITVLKIRKRFSKPKPKKVDFKKDKITMAHNCSDCSADCMLRNLPQKVIDSKADECNSTYTRK